MIEAVRVFFLVSYAGLETRLIEPDGIDLPDLYLPPTARIAAIVRGTRVVPGSVKV